MSKKLKELQDKEFDLQKKLKRIRKPSKPDPKAKQKNELVRLKGQVKAAELEKQEKVPRDGDVVKPFYDALEAVVTRQPPNRLIRVIKVFHDDDQIEEGAILHTRLQDSHLFIPNDRIWVERDERREGYLPVGVYNWKGKRIR